MFKLTIPANELFNEATNEFITIREHTLTLEHSLVSISKWEMKWEKPFLEVLRRGELTDEMLVDYVRCMTITQHVDPNVYLCLTSADYETIVNYMNARMTATTINGMQKRGPREIITSELIYYWMIANNIPMECQKWPVNRLLTLIEVCAFKNSKQQKMPKKQVMSNNAALNAARRAKLNTTG